MAFIKCPPMYAIGYTQSELISEAYGFGGVTVSKTGSEYTEPFRQPNKSKRKKAGRKGSATRTSNASEIELV